MGVQLDKETWARAVLEAPSEQQYSTCRYVFLIFENISCAISLSLTPFFYDKTFV